LGAPRAQFFGVPRGVEAIFLLKLQLLALKIGDRANKINVWPLMELLSMKLKSFRRGRTKMFFAWPLTFGAKSWRSNAIFFAFASLRALKHGAWKIEERPMAFFASTELQRNLKSY